MNASTQIAEIFTAVREHGRIIPRDYQTIGGFWTVDTYMWDKLPEVRVQLMDEGWTTAIITPNLNVYEGGNNIPNFRIGGEDELSELYVQVKELISND